jgi:hypothetical protein
VVGHLRLHCRLRRSEGLAAHVHLLHATFFQSSRTPCFLCARLSLRGCLSVWISLCVSVSLRASLAVGMSLCGGRSLSGYLSVGLSLSRLDLRTRPHSLARTHA